MATAPSSARSAASPNTTAGVGLHPLVVDPARQGEGIGRALVADFEQRVRERGGLTITLGTDDEDGRTSLGGVDLFPDPLERLQSIRSLRRHPFEFYAKLGYAIIGVVPDANGLGKPDILMGKSVARAGRALRRAARHGRGRVTILRRASRG